MIANLRLALGGTVLMAFVLVGCPETTTVQDVVSRTFTLKTGDFVPTEDADGVNWVARATYVMPEITAEVVTAGTVTAEIDLGSKGLEWSALPLTVQLAHGSDTHTVAIQARYREGRFVLLLRADLQGTVSGIVAVDGYRVRAVVIPGNAAGR